MVTSTNYKDLGLVNTREMFKKAMEGGYAGDRDIEALTTGDDAF